MEGEDLKTKKTMLSTVAVSALYIVMMIFLYFIAYAAIDLVLFYRADIAPGIFALIKFGMLSALFAAPTVIPISLSFMWYYYGSGRYKAVKVLYFVPLLIIALIYLGIYAFDIMVLTARAIPS